MFRKGGQSGWVVSGRVFLADRVGSGP